MYIFIIKILCMTEQIKGKIHFALIWMIFCKAEITIMHNLILFFSDIFSFFVCFITNDFIGSLKL